MNYLKETYGGMDKNPLIGRGFVCYIVYDKQNDMYYSGMKSFMGEHHPLGREYFTSSTVKDFTERFKKNPDLFELKVEYFRSMEEISLAERKFHDKFDVGKNKKFYNVIKAGGSNCGAASLLCRRDDGTIYRISTKEYETKKHSHVCSDRILVYIDGSNTLSSIYKKDFDPTRMKTQFSGYVLCYDVVEKKNTKIPDHVFYSNPDRYYAITKGKFTIFNKKTGEKRQIEVGVEYNRDEWQTKSLSKTVKVFDKVDKEFKNILREEFSNNRLRYDHHNSCHMTVIDLTSKEKIRVTRDEFHENLHYAKCDVKKYYVADGKLFGSKQRLLKYYKSDSLKALSKRIKFEERSIND